MQQDLIITSSQNLRIKSIASLHNKKERDEKSEFLIEGKKELELARISGIEIKELLVCTEILDPNFFAKFSKTPTVYCSKNVFAKVAIRENSCGIIAIAKKSKKSLDYLEKILEKQKNPCFVIIEGVEKPGNIGALLRTVDASGCDALIVADGCSDVFSPNVVRASLGALFTVPVVFASSQKTIDFCKQHNIQMIATVVDAKKTYTSVDMTKAIAIVLGAEHEGLQSQFKKNCQEQVHIPMKGSIDSLNVSITAGIMMYEMVRQRSL